MHTWQRMVVLQTECKEPLTNRQSCAVGNITQWAVLYNGQYHAMVCIIQWAELQNGQYHTMGCIIQWAIIHKQCYTQSHTKATKMPTSSAYLLSNTWHWKSLAKLQVVSLKQKTVKFHLSLAYTRHTCFQGKTKSFPHFILKCWHNWTPLYLCTSSFKAQWNKWLYQVESC